jgi:predicted ATP-dependent endonuclease of OLD family
MEPRLRPLAFRIHDFKSINDSTICNLSDDGISVLAGQNESGKTSILTALRDFGADEGEPPETPDYLPDQNTEKRNPRAAVKFAISEAELDSMPRDGKAIPEAVRGELLKRGHVWLHRSFLTAKFHLDIDIAKLFVTGTASTASKEAASTPSDVASDEATTASGQNEKQPLMSAQEFAYELWRHSPYIVYFDTFKDELPREISIQALVSAVTPELRKAAYDALPTTVKDFLTLAEIDIDYLSTVSKDDRILGNYLDGKAANITGHFLKYWKQRADSEETVSLRAHPKRKVSGELFLSFYVKDGVDQYPDQRSRGFLWFLSFFLRLTSSNLTANASPSLVLIDEPGTYLHSKAQKDVLALLESWIVKTHWVIYSTHSPYLLPADKLYRVRLVGKQKTKGTFIADRLTDARLKGNTFSDALSPVLTSIGMDLNQSFNLVKNRNVIVEGISDFYYLHAWNNLLRLEALTDVSIFPGTSASTVPTLASLLIGWGVHFCALLDRDGPGNGAAKKLREEMDVKESAIIQPEGGVAIEDLFLIADFEKLVKIFDSEATVDTSTSSSKALTKGNLNKVLLARCFSESVSSGKIKESDISGETRENVKALFKRLASALTEQPLAVAAANGGSRRARSIGATATERQQHEEVS